MLLTFSSDKSSPLSTHLFYGKVLTGLIYKSMLAEHSFKYSTCRYSHELFLFSAGTEGLLSGKITKTSSLIGCSLDPAMNTITLYELVAGVRRAIKNTHTDAL